MIPFLVIIRVLSNPLSNLFQKKLVSQKSNSLFIIFITYVALSIISLPLIGKIFFSGLPPEYFFYMFICAVFAVSANTLIVKALGCSDLSLLGPINSYKPIVGMVFGIFLLYEIPSWIGLFGVLLILFGSYFISDTGGSKGKNNSLINLFYDKGVRLRIAALLLSGVEAVFLKKALYYSTPLVSMGLWCFSGFIVSGITSVILLRKNLINEFYEFPENKKTFFFLFITTGLMQFTTLLIFEKMQVSYALALFQISSLVSVFLGYKYFEEKNIKERIIGSVLMIIGAAFIIIYK
jgi:drug/metabolite transporter (DMT)-like permease